MRASNHVKLKRLAQSLDEVHHLATFSRLPPPDQMLAACRQMERQRDVLLQSQEARRARRRRGRARPRPASWRPTAYRQPRARCSHHRNSGRRTDNAHSDGGGADDADVAVAANRLMLDGGLAAALGGRLLAELAIEKLPARRGRFSDEQVMMRSGRYRDRMVWMV